MITMVYSIHAPEPDHLAHVKTQMIKMGAPTIEVVDCGDHYQALEGSHRLAAAYDLGIIPIFVVRAQDDVIDITQYDWYESANWAETQYPAGEVAAELFSSHSSRDYNFRHCQ